MRMFLVLSLPAKEVVQTVSLLAYSYSSILLTALVLCWLRLMQRTSTESMRTKEAVLTIKQKGQ